MATKKTTTKKAGSPLSIIKSAAKNVVNKAVSAVKSVVSKVSGKTQPTNIGYLNQAALDKYNSGYQIVPRETATSKTKPLTPFQLITGTKPKTVLTGTALPGAGSVMAPSGTLTAPKTALGGLIKQPLLATPSGLGISRNKSGGGGGGGGGGSFGGGTTPSVNPMAKGFMTPYVGSDADINAKNATYNAMLTSLASSFGGVTTTGGPTSTNGISLGTKGTKLPGGTDFFKGGVDTQSYVAGDQAQSQTQNTFYDQRIKELETQYKDQGNWLQKLMEGQTTRAEAEQQIREREDIMQFKEFQALKEGKRAEINAIQQKYDQAEALMNQQIAQETSRFGLQDFTNNRVNQIKDAARAELSYYTAQMSQKTAELAALNEDWQTAERFINDAADAMMSEQKNNIDMNLKLFDLNQELFDAVGKEKKAAYLEALDIAQKKYDEQRELYIYEQKQKLQQKYSGTTSTTETGGQKSIFSQTQLNSGAMNAGLSIADFSALDDDIKNFFINTKKLGNKTVGDLLTLIQSVATGDESKENVVNLINNAPIPEKVKNYLITKIPEQGPMEEKTSFWDRLLSRF